MRADGGVGEEGAVGFYDGVGGDGGGVVDCGVRVNDDVGADDGGCWRRSSVGHRWGR